MKENPNPCHKNSESSVQKNSRFTRRHKIHSHGKMAEFKDTPEINPQPTLEKPFVTPSEPVIHAPHESPEMTQRTFRLTKNKTAREKLVEQLKDAGHRLVAFIKHVFQHKGR